MIKLVRIMVTGPDGLDLTFSDGATGRWSATRLIERDTILTAPLADVGYFARAFIEAGALAWPNGLELSPAALHAELASTGALHRQAA